MVVRAEVRRLPVHRAPAGADGAPAVDAKPLGRYFSEFTEGLLNLGADALVLDGEIIIPNRGFETLRLRLHPAERHVRMLSGQHPAQLIAFDMLACDGTSLLDQPLALRRAGGWHGDWTTD